MQIGQFQFAFLYLFILFNFAPELSNIGRYFSALLPKVATHLFLLRILKFGTSLRKCHWEKLIKEYNVFLSYAHLTSAAKSPNQGCKLSLYFINIIHCTPALCLVDNTSRFMLVQLSEIGDKSQFTFIILTSSQERKSSSYNFPSF